MEDNDLVGTDYTIGFDTAVNTAVQCIDKIRDTAAAHDRLFIIEVMGRDAGYIALHSGLACGAEDILLPEIVEKELTIFAKIADNTRRKKRTNIIVVAEGDEVGGAILLQNKIKNKFPNIDSRVTILGHIQRGGSPICADRILASRKGHAAVEALLAGKTQVMVGVINNQIAFTPLSDVVKTHIPFQQDLLNMVQVLSK